VAHIVTPPASGVSAQWPGAHDPTLVVGQDPASNFGIAQSYGTGAGAGSAAPGGEHEGAHDVNQPNQYPPSDAITGVGYGNGTGVPGSQGINPDSAPSGATSVTVSDPNNFAGHAGGESGTQMITVSDAVSGPDDWTATQDNYPPGNPIIPGDFYPAATGAGQGRVLRGGFANGQRS
jgi:hypothetical protein